MKVLQSVYFNAILAVAGAVLIILQEVWVGAPIVFLSDLALGSVTGVGFSWLAEVLKHIFFTDGTYDFNAKQFLIGSGCGIAAALITLLCII